MNCKAIIIDDDIKLQKLLSGFLGGYGVTVIGLTDGSDVVSTIAHENPDIIILDIVLPKRDGFEILREIRQHYEIPVIMLSAKGADTDRIVGLEMGADDYLPKPHNPRELLARIKAVLRRMQAGKKIPAQATDADHYLITGDLRLNTAKQTLSYKSSQLSLSTVEFKILKPMMQRPGVVFSREQLLNHVHGVGTAAVDRNIDTYISKLRHKIHSLCGDRDCIKTVWGTGYKFVEV